LVPPAMRLGDLPAWGVPRESVAYAEGPLGRSVHTEQPMRERQVLGPGWRQALQVNVPSKCEGHARETVRASIGQQRDRYEERAPT
jgi:hypothetical protein